MDHNDHMEDDMDDDDDDDVEGFPPLERRFSHFDVPSHRRLAESLLGKTTTTAANSRYFSPPPSPPPRGRRAWTTSPDPKRRSYATTTPSEPPAVEEDDDDRPRSFSDACRRAASQIPAVALITVFHLMIGVPFGSAYFPVDWREEEDGDGDGDVDVFPVPHKNALGVRMFLLSTFLGQIVLTFRSGFDDAIGLQMVENVPFCRALCAVAMRRCGRGPEALSTVFVMFASSSIVVGALFWALGRWRLGRIVYYFPSHVLVGLIAGVGVYLVRTAAEVATNTAFSFENLAARWDLVRVVVGFEIVLRAMEYVNVRLGRNGEPVFFLLSSLYFCAVTPLFYLGLYWSGTSWEDAERAGYFFPSPNRNRDDGRWFDEQDLFAVWTVIDLSKVSWRAVAESVPTMLSLALFSLVHVPINVPAFAVSTKTEADVDRELIAHGLSNVLAGLCGGLQNYMAYTQSLLYHRSGGFGKASGCAVAACTAVLFVAGPAVASFLPRCMAGTLLTHVGIDLFLEGVYDTIGKFERLEYVGVWTIAGFMTLYGMNAAIVTGAVSAVATYAAQTVVYMTPVRGSMSAATLRSSRLNRGYEADRVLDDRDVGRGRVLVVQLQGHLFFGNASRLNEEVAATLPSSSDRAAPLVVIMDFSLVVGMDSSAAQAVVKLKRALLENHGVELVVFVPGNKAGFPCEYRLTDELLSEDEENVDNDDQRGRRLARDDDPSAWYGDCSAFDDETASLLRDESSSRRARRFRGCRVCRTLDFALVVAEDALIHRHDPALLRNVGGGGGVDRLARRPLIAATSPEEERRRALEYLRDVVAPHFENGVDDDDLRTLLSYFSRRVYRRHDRVWRQGSESDCAMLLVDGDLVARLEDEAGTSENVGTGRMIGELGLVSRRRRMSSVYCASPRAVVYVVRDDDFRTLVKERPALARAIDLVCISYLANRVQHVSNRIFETRCLPI